MADYGLFSDELPLFLGQEKLMIFERKIALKDIKEIWWNGNNRGAVRNYKRILLGPSNNTYTVFADYKSSYDVFSMWNGGGFNIPGSGLPNFSDSIFMAGKTDNSLLLDNGNWYLLAFSPNNIAQYPESLDTDFYIYRTVDTEVAKDLYGLNVYRPDGSLAYHSGWNIVRARHVYYNIQRVTAQGLRGNGVALWRITTTRTPSLVPIEDIQAAGRSTAVGHNKLVNIGHVLHAESYWDKPQNEYVRFAPYLKDGLLGYAVAFASCGLIPPHDANQLSALRSQPTGNPIIVIDKPNI
jgi:hypothetical protein|nr:MAG TPA: hypothetical protein [Caudoviricetes sp.]